MKNTLKIRRMSALVLMSAAVPLTWLCVFRNTDRKNYEFDRIMARVSQCEDEGAYISAAEYCIRALELRENDTELMLRTAEDLRKCSDESGFLRYCRMAADAEPDSEEPWLLMGRFYCESGDMKNALDALENISSEYRTDETAALIKKVRGSFRKGYRKFSDTKGFSGSTCAVCDDSGKWGLADESGRYMIEPQYDDIGVYDESGDSVYVCENGSWFCVNSENQRKYTDDCQQSSVLYSEPASAGNSESVEPSCGLIPCFGDGAWGFSDRNGDMIIAPVFEDVYPFNDNGRTAVKENGRWTILTLDVYR